MAVRPALEAQALGPMENPIEMGHTLAELVPQLNAIPGYKERFQKVFGTDVTADGMAKAIAAFERTVLSGNSPYDKYQAGDKAALNEAQDAWPEAVRRRRLLVLPRAADVQQLQVLQRRRRDRKRNRPTRAARP